MFFSDVYGTFIKIDHVLSHKDNLSKIPKVETINVTFSWHIALHTHTHTNTHTHTHTRPKSDNLNILKQVSQ